MAETDFSPLSSACVRALNDKVYDKRKAAALEVEKSVSMPFNVINYLINNKPILFLRMTRDFANANSSAQIRRLIHVLGKEMTLAQFSNMRKGGLIGLAAMAIALGRVIKALTHYD